MKYEATIREIETFSILTKRFFTMYIEYYCIGCDIGAHYPRICANAIDFPILCRQRS